MKFKKIFTFLLSLSLLCGVFKFGCICQALFTNEEYYACLEEQDSSGIILNKINETDRQILKEMIDEDDNFSEFLGYGTDNINSDDFLEDLEINENCLNLTIKNRDNEVVGLLFMTRGSVENRFSVGYWIGRKFRGKGYANLAVSSSISKIWKLDDSISFEFWIDDKNTASIKTLEKICRDLKIDLESSSFERFAKNNIRMIAKETETGEYVVETYFCDSLTYTNIMTKEELIKKYTEERIASGVLLESSCSAYLITNPHLTDK